MTSAVSFSTIELGSFERSHAGHDTYARTYDRSVSLDTIHDEVPLATAMENGAVAVSTEEQKDMPGAYSEAGSSKKFKNLKAS
jgi:hypothetical protein